MPTLAMIHRLVVALAAFGFLSALALEGSTAANALPRRLTIVESGF